MLGVAFSILAMACILSCYYLDEALSDDEFRFVSSMLIGPWARFRTAAASLEQRRVPTVLPLPDPNGAYAESRPARAERVRANLRHAHIRADAGRQVVWVMPQDEDWDAVFRFAIREETGFAPYVAQRWFVEEGRRVRRRVRVIDTDTMLRSL